MRNALGWTSQGVAGALWFLITSRLRQLTDTRAATVNHRLPRS